jgi:hypothetical protein
MRIIKVCLQLFLFGYFLGIFWYFYIKIKSGHIVDDDFSSDDIYAHDYEISFISNPGFNHIIV